MKEDKKILHYSRCGYDGDYLYTSVCGKKVKTHQEKEGSTIHPKEANCEKCFETKEYQTDLSDFNITKIDTKRRIYIESDILHTDEFNSAQETVSDFAKDKGLKCVDRVFSDVLDFAWQNLEGTWAAVKAADEIYATSSLMPLSGNANIGAPVIFNGMCERAIKEKITGKSIIILNEFKNIYWYMIKIDIMKKAFKENNLFMYDDNFNLIKIDVLKIKK